MIFESVNQNKTKTTFIVILFFILIGLFVYFLAYIFGEDSKLAFIIATIVSSISSIISYFLSYCEFVKRCTKSFTSVGYKDYTVIVQKNMEVGI